MALPNIHAAGLGNATSSVSGVAGPMAFSGFGTFGAGTFKMQMTPDDGTTWTDVVGASWTAPFVNFQLNIGLGSKIRFIGSGGTAPTVTIMSGPIQKFD